MATDEEFLLELEYSFSEADQIVAFYEEWTASDGTWTPNEPNPEIGVVGAFVADNGDSITIFVDSPDSPTIVLLDAGSG